MNRSLNRQSTKHQPAELRSTKLNSTTPRSIDPEPTDQSPTPQGARLESTLPQSSTLRSVRAIALSLLALIFTAKISAQDDTARAQELLTTARDALGGEKLKSVQSLGLSATFQRALGDEAPQIDGEIELSISLPDKYKKSETINLPVGGASATRIEGLNGDQRFSDNRTNSTGGGMIMFRRADDRPEAQANALKATRADFARNLLGLLLTPSPAFPLEFTYAGEAQSRDGSADVIDAKGPDGFAARLFLDKQTHQPLMLSYRAPQPRFRVMTRKFSGSREEAEQKRKEIEKLAHEQPSEASKDVEIQIFLTDYRPVDGVLLPHHIAKSVDGKPSEEWDIKKYKVNPQLKPDSFSK